MQVFEDPEYHAYQISPYCDFDGMVPLQNWLNQESRENHPDDFYFKLKMLLDCAQVAERIAHDDASHICDAWVGGLPASLSTVNGDHGCTDIFIAFKYAPTQFELPIVLVSPVELSWMQANETI